MKRGYHILGKGYSGKRANALARRVTRWDNYDLGVEVGRVDAELNLGREVDTLIKRRWHKGQWRHSYYVTSLSFPSKRAFMSKYDQRGAAEVEQFRQDKDGLHLSLRRKKKFEAQKALILLTDICHNIISHFRYHGLSNSSFEGWGTKRIVRDLFAIPGRLYVHHGQLKRIELLDSHPYADEMLECLQKYCSRVI